MKKFSTIVTTVCGGPLGCRIVAVAMLMAVWCSISGTRVLYAQTEDNPPYVESTGLIVMQAESVPRPANWKFEDTEEGHTGVGYLRYIGSNHLSEPGFDIMEYNIVIEHPGTYRLFVFVSHLGAPSPDAENDVWTKLDDSEWIKTVHGSEHVDKGFSYHTTWVVPKQGGGEDFLTPEYDLEAGPHTFYISGRSKNVRVDRIHLWKFEDPFKVPFNVATDNSHPETLRDGTVLTALPGQVSFPATQVGVISDPISVSLSNGGEETISISNVSLSGANPGEFSHNFGGSLNVPAGGDASLNVKFEPSGQGFKTAKLTFEHDGINSPTSVDLYGTATSGGAGTTVLFRVNAGGPLIADGAGDWAEDQTADESHANGAAEPGNPHPYVNALATGDWTFGRNDAVSLDTSVPPGTPAAMFQRARWDPGASPNQQWNIPIDAGKEVEVRLYFAEQFFNAPDDPPDQGWPRIFDVSVDGIVYPQFDDLDILTAVGPDVGMMRSVVIISDGNVDIDLINNSHDPIIQGIEILEIGSVSRAFIPGWNLVGLPTQPADNNYLSVFDEVTPLLTPYIWNGSGYEQDATVDSGIGYWIEVAGAGSQSFDDPGVTSVSIPVSTGWNLISGPICLVPFTSILDPGSDLISGTLYSYNGGYQQSSAVLPGNGYWVEASGPGTIQMNCEAAGKVNDLASLELPSTAGFGRLSVRDQALGRQTLYFGGVLSDASERRHFSMPPRALDGLFDVRFTENSRLAEGDEHIVRLQSSAFPVELDFEELPRGAYEIRVEEFANNDRVRTYAALAGDRISLNDERVTALRLSAGGAELLDVPERFTLQGNYPNPFNPSTSIVFDMPEAGVVHLEVFDLLGRRVMSLAGQEMSAGASRQLSIDASQLASGTYIYHLRAETANNTAVQVGRMTLLK